MSVDNILYKLFSLDIVQSMYTRDTIPIDMIRKTSSIPTINLPYGKNATSLGQVGFFLYSSNSLLQD